MGKITSCVSHIHCTAMAAALLCMCSVSTGSAETGRFGVALKAGITQESIELPPIAGVSVSTEGTTAAGVSVSYNIDENQSVELEFVKGGADLTASSALRSLDASIDVDTIGLYWTQRTGGEWFFKTKIGLITENVSFSDEPDVSETGFSWGLGFGYRMSEQSSLELEYVKVEQDVAWILFSGRYIPNL